MEWVGRSIRLDLGPGVRRVRFRAAGKSFRRDWYRCRISNRPGQPPTVNGFGSRTSFNLSRLRVSCLSATRLQSQVRELAVKRRWMYVIVAIACFCSAGCGSPAQGSPPIRGSSHILKMLDLTVRQLHMPSLGLRRYRTIGTYPKFVDRGRPLRRVNETIERAVMHNRRLFKPAARSHARYAPTRIGSGLFSFSGTDGVISASPAVVSVLIPTEECFPGSNECAGWFGDTVRIHSGASVRLSELFQNPSKGLRRLAQLAKRRLLRSNACVRSAYRSPPPPPGLSPTLSNYQNFAMVRGGLTIGFYQDQVGWPECGNPEVVVPYRRLEPQLSRLGKRLEGGVRRLRT